MARSVRKVKEVPLSEVKDDLSRFPLGEGAQAVPLSGLCEERSAAR